MSHVSRRSALGSLLAAALAPSAVTASAATERAKSSRAILTAPERDKAVSALLEYFAKAGPQLFRAASGGLRYPSLSPSVAGSAYSTELWDWDTYWTASGLFHLAERRADAALRADVAKHLEGSLLNFFDNQAKNGRIPIMISAKDPDFFHSTGNEKPNPHNQAKPVLAQMALLLSDKAGSTTWLAPHFDRLMRFLDSWTVDNLSHTGLMVAGNDVAIGADNDPTTFGRPDFSSANLLLNCLYYQDVSAAAQLAQRLGRAADAQRLQTRASNIASAIQKHCWDPRDGFFYTADVQCVDVRSKWLSGLSQGMAMSWSSLPMRIQMFTGFLPLWCGIATPEQMRTVIEKHYKTDDRFRAQYGVRSLSNLETMYSLTPHSGNPSNWLGPVWIISNYFVWSALQRSGFLVEAKEMADKTILLLSRDLATSGTLNEYYHPDSGEPLSHKGFVDWNLLVLAML